MNNIQFYKKNINIFLKLRPDCSANFKWSDKHVSYTFSGLKSNSIDDIELAMDILPALNSSIILNCFSLFEASFESRLLHELDISNLNGIQEKVMTKYIDEIIKLSSEEKYAKEFKFITGNSLNDFFSTDENEKYKTIKAFYQLRNLLIHGSVTKRVIIPFVEGGKIEMDLDDMEYQKLILLLKDKLEIGIPNKLFILDLLLINNQVTNLLVEAVLTISNKFIDNTTQLYNL